MHAASNRWCAARGALHGSATSLDAPASPPTGCPTCTEPPVIIVGCGPAGLFAALAAWNMGLRPVVLERGKDVRARRRDLAAINREHIVDPDSNYCFGEGGAGTYSDGKLYTRSHKRGDVGAVLRTLVDFGASRTSWWTRIRTSAPTSCPASSPPCARPSSAPVAKCASTNAWWTCSWQAHPRSGDARGW
jgi:hypothetical protein